MTKATRQMKYEASRSKLMIPKETRSILDSKAKTSGQTASKLIEQLINQYPVQSGQTHDTSVITTSGQTAISISGSTAIELNRLAERHGMTQQATLERLIMQGIVEKFNGAEKARELLQEYGTRKAAIAAFHKELTQECPGFKTISDLPEYAEGGRRYQAVSAALKKLTMETTAT